MAPQTIRLTDGLDGAVARAAATLHGGGVVLLPTDTVYGIAALASHAAAASQLSALKDRQADVPIAVLCADASQALSLAEPDQQLQRVAARWWPGPLTLVARRRHGVALHLGEPADTVGLRVPDHELVRSIAAEVGPIATTSANRHGEPTPASAADAAASLAGEVALVIDGGSISGEPSTVVDTTTEPWRALRAGPLPAADVIASATRR